MDALNRTHSSENGKVWVPADRVDLRASHASSHARGQWLTSPRGLSGKPGGKQRTPTSRLKHWKVSFYSTKIETSPIHSSCGQTISPLAQFHAERPHQGKGNVNPVCGLQSYRPICKLLKLSIRKTIHRSSRSCGRERRCPFSNFSVQTAVPYLNASS